MKLKSKSKEKINIYKNKTIKMNKNISKNITYNKPLFISMKNDNNICNNSFNLNPKISTISTKICTTNGESPCNRSLGNNVMNNNYNRINVKDFEIDNNYSKTTLNFFSKYINTSISSNEDYNNNYETFTPSRQKNMEFIEEDKEQFTPYLGEKKSNDKNSKENKKECLNKKNNKYSIIFNNSKKDIDSISLNLRNHFDEELSNKYKIINKYQKLSFYQKKNGLSSKSKSRNKKKDIKTNYSNFIKLNGNSKNINKQILYKKKSDLSFHRENERKILEWFYIHNIDISEREIYEKYAILIQTIFRGYISRIKLYNKLKIYTCFTVFNQIINNIYFENNKYFLKYCLQKIKKYNKNIKKRLYISKNSFIIEGDDNKSKLLCNEIKELIEQNNQLQAKLNEFLINNNSLKKSISNYKELEFKYNKLLIQIEKLQNANNNILKENNRLTKELNNFKNNYKIKNDLLETQKIINIIINRSNKNNSFKNIEIQNVNNMEIKDILKLNNKCKLTICSNINKLTILNSHKSFNSFQFLNICNNSNHIEINYNGNIHIFKELEICNKVNNFELIHKNEGNVKPEKFKIEKQNNFNFSQSIKSKKLSNLKFIIENKENFQINKSLLQKIKKVNFAEDKINNPYINVKKDKEEKLKNQKIAIINNSIKIDEVNPLLKDILKNEENLYSDKEENIGKKDSSCNNRSSIRISLKNEKIESQEIKLEWEESNLSKEQILKRKRLRNLFQIKLFLLRDILRKYFLRFYYNGIYIKMVGKKPKPIEKLDRTDSEDIIIRRKNREKTSYVQKAQYVRKLLAQKVREKKEALRKNFFLFRQGIDIQNIRKKLIYYKNKQKEEKIISRNKLLSSFINKINNGSFSLLNLKRSLIIWKYKMNNEQKKEINELNNININQKESEKDNNNKKDTEKEENEEEEEDNSIENYIKYNLKRNFIFDNEDDI